MLQGGAFWQRTLRFGIAGRTGRGKFSLLDQGAATKRSYRGEERSESNKLVIAILVVVLRSDQVDSEKTRQYQMAIPPPSLSLVQLINLSMCFGIERMLTFLSCEDEKTFRQ